MLEDVYKSYKQCAEVIDWKKYNCNDLFFEYIKHEHDELAENFYAGIVCRYWGYSGKIYMQCNQHVPFEQCYDVLIETINYVLEKRVWENPSSSLYQDKRGPDKAFHIVIKRQRGCLLSNLAAYKRKTNFNTQSIDALQEEYADAAEGLFNIYDKQSAEEFSDINLISYIKSKPDLQKIILNQICFGKYTSNKGIASNIKKLTVDDYPYFRDMYDISKENFTKVISDIKGTTTNRLNQEIGKTLTITKKEYFA